MNSKKPNRKQEEQKSPRQIIGDLSSDAETGLSDDEAKKRLDKCGRHDIQEKKTSPIVNFCLISGDLFPG